MFYTPQSSSESLMLEKINYIKVHMWTMLYVRQWFDAFKYYFSCRWGFLNLLILHFLKPLLSGLPLCVKKWMHVYIRTSQYQYSYNVNSPSGLLFPKILCSHYNDQTQQREDSAVLTVKLLVTKRQKKMAHLILFPSLTCLLLSLAQRWKRSWTQAGEEWVSKFCIE